MRLFFWYVGPEAAQRLPVAMEAPHLLIGGLEVADPGTPHPPRDVEFTNFSTMFPSQAYRLLFARANPKANRVRQRRARSMPLPIHFAPHRLGHVRPWCQCAHPHGIGENLYSRSLSLAAEIAR